MSIIIVMSKAYTNIDALDNIIAYGLNIAKSDLNKNVSDIEWICHGVTPLTPQHIINSFGLPKRLYGKCDGKQLHHFVLSIYTKYYFGKSSKEKWCSMLGYDVGDYIKTQGFQNISFVHVKDDGNVHIHFVVNSVNAYTGKKPNHEKYFYNNLLHYLSENYHNLNWENIYYNK